MGLELKKKKIKLYLENDPASCRDTDIPKDCMDFPINILMKAKNIGLISVSKKAWPWNLLG